MDENYECAVCQEKFIRRMKKVQAESEELMVIDRVPTDLIKPILIDATNMYKIDFRGKAKLVDFINEKYELSITPHILDKLTMLMSSYGLSWKHLDKK